MKKFLTLSVLFFSAFAFGCSNEEMLTYTNDEYGFSIDYPSDWGMTKAAQIPQGFTNILSVGILKNPNNLELQDIFNAQYQQCLEIPDNAMGCPGPVDVSSFEPLLVAGKNALHAGFENTISVAPKDAVYISMPGYFIVISAQYQGSEVPDDFNLTFTNILDSFRFN